MKALVPLIFLFLAGCSTVPVAIKEAPKPDWQLAEVGQQVSQHQGEAIRWGGQVIKVENNDEGSLLHIVQFPLNSFGRPNSDQKSQGRFLALSNDFVDPYIYKSGTLVTVAGRLADQRSISVDKKTMTVPMVQVGTLYRWAPAQQYYRAPYWSGYPYYYDRFGYGLSYPHWRSHWYYGRGYYW